MGWGGIIAMGAAGAVAGAADAGVNDIIEKDKQAALALRDQQLAALQTQRDISVHAANTAFDTKNKIDNAPALGAAEGAAAAAKSKAGGLQAFTDQEQAKNDIDTAGKIKEKAAPGWKDPAQEDYWKAHTAETQARTDEIRQKIEDLKAGGKGDFPNIKGETGDDGSHYLIDQKKGLMGKYVAGEAATPAETHWFGPDTPGKPATPSHIEWSKGGKVVSLDDYYPSLKSAEAKAQIFGDLGKPPEATPSSTPDAPAHGGRSASGVIRALQPNDSAPGAVPQGTPANGQPIAGFPGTPKGAGYTGRAAPVDRMKILQQELSDENSKDGGPDPRNVTALQFEIAKLAKTMPASSIPGATPTGKYSPSGKPIFQTPDGQKWTD